MREEQRLYIYSMIHDWYWQYKDRGASNDMLRASTIRFLSSSLGELGGQIVEAAREGVPLSKILGYRIPLVFMIRGYVDGEYKLIGPYDSIDDLENDMIDGDDAVIVEPDNYGKIIWSFSIGLDPDAYHMRKSCPPRENLLRSIKTISDKIA